MTSAAVLFYGRRSRTSRSFDDLGFGSLAPSPFSTSSSSSSSSSTTTTTTTTSSDSNICYNHRHRHHHNRRRGDLHRRHRQIDFDDLDNSRNPSNALHPSARLSLPGSELHHGSNDELPPHDINNRETVRGPGGRYRNGNRLPGSVLLAKERLVQRLRGVSVSRNRENRETSASVPSNPLLVVDAHWVLTESPIGTHHHSAFREQQSKPLGLGHEALSQLHHEVFTKPQITTTLSTSEASNECSICLESFVEGNKLVNLPCGHRFHSSCLYPWLQTCGECPYCRSSIMLK